MNFPQDKGYLFAADGRDQTALVARMIPGWQKIGVEIKLETPHGEFSLNGYVHPVMHRSTDRALKYAINNRNAFLQYLQDKGIALTEAAPSTSQLAVT